jgi:hypothetical protein
MLARPSGHRYIPGASRSVAQSGSAPRSGRGGRRFKSCHSDQYLAEIPKFPGTDCGTDCFYRVAEAPFVGGWNSTTTRRDRRRDISLPSKLDSGKFGPRVQTNVSRSSSRV